MTSNAQSFEPTQPIEPVIEVAETVEAAEAVHAAADGSAQATVWERLTHWRRSRPFWGCALLLLGGYLVLKPMIGSVSMITLLGTDGAAPILLGAGMMAAALVALFLPSQRHFPAIMALMFSVASLPLANLGGWILGMLFGILGSGMIFAWAPFTEAELEKRAERRAMRDARRRQATA